MGQLSLTALAGNRTDDATQTRNGKEDSNTFPCVGKLHHDDVTVSDPEALQEATQGIHRGEQFTPVKAPWRHPLVILFIGGLN